MSYISIIDNINNKSETDTGINNNNDKLMDNVDSENKEIVKIFLKEYREYSKKTDKLLDNLSIEKTIIPNIYNIYNIEPQSPGIITICSFFLSIGFITYTVRKNNIPEKVLINSSSSDSISSVENIEDINDNSSENKQTGFFSYFS